uniref:Si:ch211-159i8.4 n=1 Tax=Erpetoichthys calabaricus TaxID=27687 RepID=A0A8C4XAY7_ERPCA
MTVSVKVVPDRPRILSKEQMFMRGRIGESATMKCDAIGEPKPKIIWLSPGNYIITSSNKYQVLADGTLVISNLELRGLRRSDSGQYFCVASNEMGETKLTVELEVIATAERPGFPLPHNMASILKPGSREIILDCLAHGKPAPQVTWLLPNGTQLAPENGALLILNPTGTDAGTYRCLAKNIAGQAEKRYVLEPGRKPQPQGNTGLVRISYGDTLNLHCSFEGWPQPSISWILPSGLVMDKPQVIGRASFLANSTLSLREVATFDRGTYTCKASNEFGISSLSIPVMVTVHPPHITNGPPSISRIKRGYPIYMKYIQMLLSINL